MRSVILVIYSFIYNNNNNNNNNQNFIRRLFIYLTNYLFINNWRLTSRQYISGVDPHRFSPFLEMSRIFHNKYSLRLSKVKYEKWFGLALFRIYINISKLTSVDEIVRRFARLHPRRMELVNILSLWLRNPGKGTSGSYKNPQKYRGSMPPESRRPQKPAPWALV